MNGKLMTHLKLALIMNHINDFPTVWEKELKEALM